MCVGVREVHDTCVLVFVKFTTCVCWCPCGYLKFMMCVLVSVRLPEVHDVCVCVLVSVGLPEVHNVCMCVGTCVC